MWGYNAEAAYSADDAVSKTKALDPDVILLDLGSQIVNGFDLANELRRYCPAAKLVAITAFTARDIVRRARNAGFEKVLVKPAPAAVLEEVAETECAATAAGSS